MQDFIKISWGISNKTHVILSSQQEGLGKIMQWEHWRFSLNKYLVIFGWKFYIIFLWVKYTTLLIPSTSTWQESIVDRMDVEIPLSLGESAFWFYWDY